ncbi:hypothetical protein EJ08DRAFT_662312 [Tothia fuscella]|uniref:CNH domain-containing protein n=1 Tax=Tothia fuscella TaxID=1048955 RepID=A0A9P4NNP4_9PEZI|nr:hypothetical protein EJ08DRAFT_662312 [Tothia fuscella]
MSATMLSAFIARPIVELKQRDKSKIESILTYSDRLLIGLNTGSLRIYRVNEPSLSSEDGINGSAEDGEEAPKSMTKPVDLLREEEKFSRRPIQQLAIIKEANMLVSLSDGCVSIHNLQTFTLQERLERTKGAAAFAVTSNIVKDASTGIPSIVSRLAVAVKRRIILWSWQDMELDENVPELSMIASVKSLSWATATKIVVGLDPGFVMVDIVSKEVTDIVKPGVPGEATPQLGVRFGAVNSAGMGYMGMGGWVPKPMAARLAEGEMLLAKDVNTLFINTDGKALDKRQVPWALAPEAIGYSYPYMLALQPPSRGILEVRNPDTLSLLQTVALPNATFLHVPQPNISLAHAGKGFLVGSDRVIWRMGALEYESQIDLLRDQGRYDEAISLLGMLEETLLKDKEGRLREIKMLKAQGLFDQRRYRDSLDLFSEAHAPPSRVIALYPKSIAGDLSIVQEAEDEPETEEAKDGEGDTSKEAPTTPNIAAQSSIGRSMFGRLKADAKKADADTASIKPSRTGTGGSDGGRPSVEITAPEKPKAFDGRDLKIAINELCAFLAQTRVQLQKYISYDGTLKQPLPERTSENPEGKPSWHNYIALPSDSDLKDFDWRKHLFEVATLVDTSLFRAYMLARPSLAGSLFRLDNFCDPDVVNAKLYESGRYGDLIDFLHGKKLHREALEVLAKFGKGQADEDATTAEDLKGPQRTVGYLQQLPPELIDLILEFAKWPLEENPDMGMQVFLADTENAETLPRHKVLDFLNGIDSTLGVKYLEHIIYELNDYTPEFHQKLLDAYLERLKADPEKAGFKDDDEKLEWRLRLERLLKSSGQYSRARALKQLPINDPTFFESRAIVLSQMGNHRQALQIYVFQIRDHAKAEEYCNMVYLSSSSFPSETTLHHSTLTPKLVPPSLRDQGEDGEPGIYHTLLSLYLTPPGGQEVQWPPALDLLSKHGARLPASSTLDIIPPTLPVKELENYFRGRIRSANTAMNEDRIRARLEGVVKGDVEEKLLLGVRGRKVVVGEERLCGVCGKRFGGAAVRVYPDGGVTHYGCVRGGRGSGAAGVGKVGAGVRGW